MKILLTLVSAAFALTGAQSHAAAAHAPCEKKIILLPQLENSPILPAPIAMSQYMVLKELDNFQGVPVFTENINEDMSAEEVRGEDTKDERLAEVKEAFPKGIPADFESLNPEQKKVLINSGGDVVALMSGHVDNLYAAMNGHNDLKTAQERGRKALGEINAYFNISPETKTVVLILDSQNEITRQTDLFDPECVVTPPEIKEFTKPPAPPLSR